MKGWMAIRKPVGAPVVLDTSATNVTNAAYVQILAATTIAASGVQLHNSGSVPIAIAMGAAGSEVNQVVLPIGVSILIPFEIPKGKRLSVISLGGTQSSGIISASFFQ
jgi:hypothetical protein